jgi:hypothetical protein
MTNPIEQKVKDKLKTLSKKSRILQMPPLISYYAAADTFKLFYESGDFLQDILLLS